MGHTPRLNATPEELSAPWHGWCILELMGHRKLGGKLSTEKVAGVEMVRIDVYAASNIPVATQFYSAASIYAISPCTEQTARAMAEHYRPAPVTAFDVRPAALAAERPPSRMHTQEDDDPYYEDE
jgi:hypothetical protein